MSKCIRCRKQKTWLIQCCHQLSLLSSPPHFPVNSTGLLSMAAGLQERMQMLARSLEAKAQKWHDVTPIAFHRSKQGTRSAWAQEVGKKNLLFNKRSHKELVFVYNLPKETYPISHQIVLLIEIAYWYDNSHTKQEASYGHTYLCTQGPEIKWTPFIQS